MGQFNLEDYDTVESRLVKFWAEHPGGRILTSMLHYDESRVVVKAEVWFGEAEPSGSSWLKATGIAEEIRGAGPVNKTSHVENAETSAIGRALANCGYSGNLRPSREEMEKVERGPQVTTSVEEFDGSAEDIITRAFAGATVDTSPPKSYKPTGNVQTTTPITPKQMGLVRSLIRGSHLSDEEALTLASATVAREIGSLGELDKGEGSAFITALKAL